MRPSAQRPPLPPHTLKWTLNSQTRRKPGPKNSLIWRWKNRPPLNRWNQWKKIWSLIFHPSPKTHADTQTGAPYDAGPPQVLWKFQPPRRSHAPRQAKPKREIIIPQRKAPKREISETRLLDPAIAQAREAEKNNAQNRNKSRPKAKPAKPQGNIKLSSKSSEHEARAQKARPQAADKPIDPDSPFAKLQALKERMQKSA